MYKAYAEKQGISWNQWKWSEKTIENKLFFCIKNVHNKMRILKNEMGRNPQQKGSNGKINGKLEDA